VSWRDADKALARGSAPGTKAGRAIRLTSTRPARASLSRGGTPRPPDPALAVFKPAAMPWQADAGWLLLVLAVGIAYASVMHSVPWFLVVVPIGRLVAMLALGRRVWIAVTPDRLHLLEGSAEVWSVPRTAVAAIHVARHGASRLEFVDRSGAPVVTAPLMYGAGQIARMAEVLVTPVIDHRG